MTNNFVFEADQAAKTIRIVREFNAPIEKVWKAFTEADLIDKWIAPKPWTAKTKIMNFTVTGVWLYAMISPDGQKHWSHAEFTAIEHAVSFSSINTFSDEDGNTPADAPKSYTETTFFSLELNRTKVEIVKIFTEESTIKMFVERGFKEGTIMGYNQLDELLASE